MNALKTHLFRTHTCGQLRESNVGEKVKLSGWIHKKRDHGGLLFLDLRDNYGLTQCVINESSKYLEQIEKTQLETVITIVGTIRERENETINDNIATGKIEVAIEEFLIENSCEYLPFSVSGELDSSEELRLKYRYVDLRRERIHNNITLRSKVISYIRKHMEKLGFMEIQTPILTASSPEGARDFLVPSRLHPGKFYALPQAPQMFKQLLMISGFDKYFQIAPCFRDEDARRDRSPGEFYQLDLEMSYCTQDDVFEVMESTLSNVFKKFGKLSYEDKPFVRIPYKEAMLTYGSDKPDLRNPLKIVDGTEIFKESEFSIFAKQIDKGAVVRAIKVKSVDAKPRSFFDKLNEWARAEGYPGLGYITFSEENGMAKGPIAKFLDQARIDNLVKLLNINPGDGVFFSCGNEKEAAILAGLARTKIGKELQLIDENIYKFCWIIDFPMFEMIDGKIDFSHNPFSMPQGGLEALNTKNPLDILAYQYDIVCNGYELSSGAIRNHRLDIMIRAFEIAGYSEKELKQEFSGLFEALRYGAPPHGGSAPGIERIIMLLTGENNLREVTPFPMNQKAQDLMMNAPNTVNKKCLDELGIMLTPASIKALGKNCEEDAENAS